MAIVPVSTISSTSGAAAPANSTSQAVGGPSFSSVLGHALDQVNGLLQSADAKAVSYAAGGPVTIDQLMIAEQQASLALDLVVQTRDRVVNAYQTLMNMQV
jgi:flagellar hook-basal body complex protein FliE